MTEEEIYKTAWRESQGQLVEAGMHSELKPCPFCGSNKVRLADVMDFHFVKCDFCGNEGLKDDAVEEAIAAWNRRALPHEPSSASLIRTAGGDGNEAMTTDPTKWAIDRSTDSPILTYEQCSVIQDEQAEYVLDLIRRDALTHPAHSGQAVAGKALDPDMPADQIRLQAPVSGEERS